MKLGFINFGGPSGQIALMHEELVERKRWIGEGRFLHALAFCMLLPGPEAQQLAIYIGWLLHKARGGIVAGVFFVLPSFFLILALSWTYAAHGDVDWIGGVFLGLSAGVLGMVVAALLRIGARALTGTFAVIVALTSFVAIFFVGVAFPVVVLGAALAGYVAFRIRPGLVRIPAEIGAAETGAAIDDAMASAPHTQASLRRALRVLGVGLVVWWAPLAAVIAWRGTGDVLSREAVFFSTAAMVTFGGAYAVLAYVNQAAVYRFGWLSPGGRRGRAGARRVHARAADHGDPVRRVPGRLSQPRRSGAADGRACSDRRSPSGPRSRRASSGSSWALPTSSGSGRTGGSGRRSGP